MKNIKFLLLLILVFHAKLRGEELALYEKYADEIVDVFAREMEAEFDLCCIGSGGRMPYDVEQIEVLFVAYRKPTIEEVREIEVRGIQKLLNLINNHTFIRPYLHEFPFKTDRVRMSLSFRTDYDEHYTDGSVAFVYLTNNKIFYDAAKKKIIPAHSLIDGSTGEVAAFFDERESVELFTIKEESFEEAVEILGDNHYYRNLPKLPKQQTVSRFKYF